MISDHICSLIIESIKQLCIETNNHATDYAEHYTLEVTGEITFFFKGHETYNSTIKAVKYAQELVLQRLIKISLVVKEKYSVKNKNH